METKTRKVQVMKRKLPAITLIETILSIALLAVIAGFSLPILQAFQFQNEMQLALNTVQSGIRLAQNSSRAVNKDSSWGIKISSGSVIVFKGTTYDTRDTTEDRSYQLPTRVTVSGTTEFVFNKQDVTPVTIGTLNLAQTNRTAQISINSIGGIDVVSN